MKWAVSALDPDAKRLVGRGLSVAGVAAGYYAGALIGTVLSVPPFGFAIIWPATAFIIAVLLIIPVQRWWMYLAAVTLAHFHLVGYLLQPGIPFMVMLSQVAGNLALAAATVLGVRAASKAPVRFDNFRVVLSFVLLAGVAIPAIGNALILCLHLLTGWADDFWLSWRQWMLASVFPTITIPPLIAIAHARGWGGGAGAVRSADLETVLLAAVLFGVSLVAFGWNLESEWWPALLLAPLPLLLWTAVRLGVAGTCLSLLALAAAIVVHALNGEGPFAVQSSLERLIALQVFLIAISAPLILLAALVEERQRTGELLRQSEARMQVVAASTDTGLWQWDETRQRLWTTDHCRSMFGLESAGTVTPEAFLDAIHQEDRARVQAHLARMLTSPDVEALEEFRVVRPGDEPRWFIVRTHTEFDSKGSPIRVSGVFRDITPRVTAQREARSLAQRLQTVQEDERRRIAQDQQEWTSQDLVAVGLRLRALSRQMALTDAAGSAMDEIIRTVYQAISELRMFAFLLRPAGLGGDDLCAVLQRYVDGFSRRTGLKATLRTSPVADQLPPDWQRAMLRIVHESLTNVHRHAAATRVSVDLRFIANALHLVVSDNGEGMSLWPEQEKPPHSGLDIPGMTARVGHLRGRIAVRSSSKGTIVHAAIPVASEAGYVRSASAAG